VAEEELGDGPLEDGDDEFLEDDELLENEEGELSEAVDDELLDGENDLMILVEDDELDAQIHGPHGDQYDDIERHLLLPLFHCVARSCHPEPAGGK